LRDGGGGTLAPGLEILRLVPPGRAILALLVGDLRILLAQLADEARDVGLVSTGFHGGLFRKRLIHRHFITL